MTPEQLAEKYGQDPAKNRAQLDEVNRTATWRAQCGRCGRRVVGTQAQLMEHRCDGAVR